MKGQLLRIAVQWPSQPVQSKASEMRLCMYIRVLVYNCTWWVSLLRWGYQEEAEAITTMLALKKGSTNEL